MYCKVSKEGIELALRNWGSPGPARCYALCRRANEHTACPNFNHHTTLETPFQAAALAVCALCVYAADRNIGTKMLNWLRGPRPLSAYDISFLNERFREGYHVPFSYFAGSTPENGYTPEPPFTLIFEAGPYADANPGYKKLHIRSGGADSPREIVLRQTAEGKWCLWDQFLLVGIRQLRSQNPWA